LSILHAETTSCGACRRPTSSPIHIEVAREALSQRRKLPDLSAFEAVVGAGDPLDESILKTVASKIRKAQAVVVEKAWARGARSGLLRRCRTH